jgi:hypothetical protein
VKWNVSRMPYAPEGATGIKKILTLNLLYNEISKAMKDST